MCAWQTMDGSQAVRPSDKQKNRNMARGRSASCWVKLTLSREVSPALPSTTWATETLQPQTETAAGRCLRKKSDSKQSRKNGEYLTAGQEDLHNFQHCEGWDDASWKSIWQNKGGSFLLSLGKMRNQKSSEHWLQCSRVGLRGIYNSVNGGEGSLEPYECGEHFRAMRMGDHFRAVCVRRTF